ncbi:DNA ligase [Marinobacter sp. 1Y8]
MPRLLYRVWLLFFASLTLLLLATTTHAQPPQILLGESYQQGINLSDYWVSEKLDGVRAYWDGKQLLSRQGHRFHAPDWFVADFPEQPLDGELWMGRGRFSETSGAVRKLEPVDAEWRQIRLMVFDLPASRAPFSERVVQMQALLSSSNSPYIAMIDQHRATSHDALMSQLDQVVADGGEGLMLHDGNSLYRVGRSDDVLKVKRYQDAEAVVVGHTEGNGKYEGQLGALIVERADGRRFKLGTGFSDDERASPPNVGATVTYKHFGYTATGLPRFASFMRVRNDEPEGGI